MYTLYADGASKSNPGHSGCGVLLLDSDQNAIFEGGFYDGIKTNNQAEYGALIKGLEIAQRHKVSDLKILLDSQLIVRQVQGQYRVKNKHLQELFKRVQELLSSFESYQIEHIYRDKNTIADYYASETAKQKRDIIKKES